MDFEQVRQQVFAKKPLFKQTIDRYGSWSLRDYFSHISSAPCLVPEERRKELLAVLKEKIASFFGKDIAEAAVGELAERNFVSTADHHGLLAHPFFLSCHLAGSSALQETNYRYQFVFSCAGISLNNSSLPRNFLVHDENFEFLKFPFFSLKERHKSIYACEKYTHNSVETIQKKIVAHHGFSSSQRIKVLDLLWEIFGAPQVLSASSFSDQITLVNYHLWSQLPGVGETKLIFLSQEELVVDLLVRFHLGKHTLLDQLFGERSVLDAFEETFDGLVGAFSKKDSSGTLLVWGLVNGERRSLWRKNNELVTLDGTYRLPLTPEDVRQAFLKKEIMPSMALSFIVLSFYYGLVCGGGFSQVNYLTDLKEAFLNFLTKLSVFSNEEKNAAHLTTDRFTGEINYIFLEEESRRCAATALDLILYQADSTGQVLSELTHKCSLSAAIDQMIPELYRIIYHELPPAIVPPFPHPSVLCLKNV